MEKLRLLIADQHTIVREALRRLLEVESDVWLLGEAADGAETCSRVAALQPDVVILETMMPRLAGCDTVRHIRAEHPGTKVLALSMVEEPTPVREMFSAGANGYVLKRSPSSALLHAVRTVAVGGLYVDPLIASSVLLSSFAPSSRAPFPPDGELSARERDVLRLIAQGYSNKEIAVALSVSVKTIETYKARAMQKRGLKSRVDIMRMAVRSGWLNAHDSPAPLPEDAWASGPARKLSNSRSATRHPLVLAAS